MNIFQSPKGPKKEKQGGRENRRFKRKEVGHATFFATKDQLYEGYVRNISFGGVFVECEDAFLPGEVVTLAIPCATNDEGKQLKPPYKDEEVKMKCEVMWRSPQGYGMRFIKD